MELPEYVELLRAVDWNWDQEQMAAFVVRSGWQPATGKSRGDTERRTYTNADGWRWSVWSKRGRLSQTDTTIRCLTFAADAAPAEVEAAERQLAAEYAEHLAVLRGHLGLERYEGEWRWADPRIRSFEEAVRLAQWAFESGSLTLSQCATPPDGAQGRWLAMGLLPDG